MTDSQWHVVGRGFAGWYAEGIDVSSSRGTLERYLRDAADGALVYDADHLQDDDDRRAYVSFVVNGPMVDPKLAPGTVNSLTRGERQVAGMMTGPGGLQGEFRTLALMAQDETYSGLDRVAVDVYERLLRAACPNVRFGRVMYSTDRAYVRWEDGA